MKIWIRRSDSSEGSAIGIDLRSIINSATVNGVTEPDVSDLLIKCSEVIFVGLCRPSELFLSLGTSIPPKPISNRKTISALMKMAENDFRKQQQAASDNSEEKKKKKDENNNDDEDDEINDDDDEEEDEMKAFVLCPRPGSEDHFVGISSPTRQNGKIMMSVGAGAGSGDPVASASSSSQSPTRRIHQQQPGTNENPLSSSPSSTAGRPAWVDRVNAGKHAGSSRSIINNAINNDNRDGSVENNKGNDHQNRKVITPSRDEMNTNNASNNNNNNNVSATSSLPPLHQPSPVKKSNPTNTSIKTEKTAVTSSTDKNGVIISRKQSPSVATSSSRSNSKVMMKSSKNLQDSSSASNSRSNSKSPQQQQQQHRSPGTPKPMWGYSHVTSARKSTPVSSLLKNSSSPSNNNNSNNKSLNGVSPILPSATKQSSSVTTKRPTTSSRHNNHQTDSATNNNKRSSSTASSTNAAVTTVHHPRRSASTASSSTNGLPTKEEMERELDKSSRSVPDHLKAQTRSSYLTRKQSQDRSQHNFTHQAHPLRQNVNLTKKKEEIDEEDLKSGTLALNESRKRKSSSDPQQQQQLLQSSVHQDEEAGGGGGKPHFAQKLNHPRMIRSSGNTSSRSLTPTPPIQHQVDHHQNNNNNNSTYAVSMNPSDIGEINQNNNNENENDGLKTYHHVACDNFVPTWGLPRVCNNCKAQRRDHAKTVTASKMKQHQSLLNQRRNAKNIADLYTIDGHRRVAQPALSVANENENTKSAAIVAPRVRSNTSERRGSTKIQPMNKNNNLNNHLPIEKKVVATRVVAKRSSSNNSNSNSKDVNDTSKKIHIPVLNLRQNNDKKKNNQSPPPQRTMNDDEYHDQYYSTNHHPHHHYVDPHNNNNNDNNSIMMINNFTPQQQIIPSHYHHHLDESQQQQQQVPEEEDDAVYTDASESTKSSTSDHDHDHDENENKEEKNHSSSSYHQDQQQYSYQQRLGSTTSVTTAGSTSSNGFLGSIARVSAALIEGEDDTKNVAVNNNHNNNRRSHSNGESKQNNTVDQDEERNVDGDDGGKVSFDDSVVSESAPTKYDEANVDWNYFDDHQQKQRDDEEAIKNKKAKEEEEEELRRQHEKEREAEAERKRKLAHFSEF